MEKENKILINANVEVLDKDICSKCRYFLIDQRDDLEVTAGDQIVYTIKGGCYCTHLATCKYLQKLFASETPSKVEESESDP